MAKSFIFFVKTITIILLLIFFIIISYKFSGDNIISEVNNSEIIFAHEYMSGGDDDVAFSVACIIFLPVTILYLIYIIKRKKEPIIALIVTILLQVFFTHIFLEYGNLYLNILYGAIIFKIWIITFGLIISYVIINLLTSLIIKIKNNI